MVFKKSLDYGFNAFGVSTVPRAPRSIRRRGQSKRTVDDKQISAFELLASLAGKLLEESESSAASNASEGHDHVSIDKDVVKQEIEYDDKQLKSECIEHVSCEESVVASDWTTEHSENLKEFKHSENNAMLECTLTKMQPAYSEQIKGNLNSAICKRNVAYGKFPGDLDGCSTNYRELCDGICDNGVKQEQEAKVLESGPFSIAKNCSKKDPLEAFMKFPAPVNSERDVKLPSRSGSLPTASFSRHRNDIKLGSVDDDEKISRFNKLSNRFNASRPPTCIEDQRIRKLVTSKYWKVAPKLKDFEHFRADGGIKPLHRKRKTYYNYDKCQYDTLYKRRKLLDHSSIVTSDGGIGSKSVPNPPEKVKNESKSISVAMSQACETPSLLTGHQASHNCTDSHVKLSIKSFRIPELYIEVPESATVGSLKRTVMEAVTALLGGRICVGVLFQGKKVRDDSRTLSQSGISSEDNLDALGFTLEPGPAIAPPPLRSEEPLLLLPCGAAPQNLTSPLSTPALDTKIPDVIADPPSLTISAKAMDSNYKHTSSQTNILTDHLRSESRALVPVAAMNVEALSVVPANRKIRKSELAQRRTRRPFSVSEVEALVQAVEELGTGRWRDVKLHAFENADHRTYVDLKDKWKTLVHTAKISPQQRRGEPVPQELLDRVMVAHAYWSQHQAKQQGKHHARTLRITNSQADRNGVAVVSM
ncbi:Telomeric DNA binding protein 1, putative isoform 2 [Hibiscus syriacus]|uniref:Telomeric DNA binding protein 1, putative isoform 2 n=1 Tax=Hibiscus syriacus TaxID=106335 RepID=A0A6A3AFS1_HIBSY|nr:Telomeric DNA binding protein 1, putative isoform 2 [Hibiscus syriacus]